MKKFQTIGFFLLSVIAIAVLLQSCSKDNEKFIDITSSFDPVFAKALQARGYIPDANRILVKDVDTITALNIAEIDDTVGELTALKGIEYFTSLRWLNCSENRLISLDVSGCTWLEYLDCSENKLISLDVSGCIWLNMINCFDNELTSLDVSNNTALSYLNCNINRLTSLDVSNNTALENLICFSNQLTSLDIRNNKLLENLRCYDNPGDGTKFNVAAWFNNNCIPSSDWYYYEFTTGSWSYNGRTIYINYYIP